MYMYMYLSVHVFPYSHPSLLTPHSSSFTPQLLDFLSDSDEGTAKNVLAFVREAIQQYLQLKGNVVGKLLEVFSLIKSVK